MRINMQRLSLLLIFLVVALAAWADLSDYSFTQSTATYNEITGGTILGTNENNTQSFDAIPLGFTFTFNDEEYSQISVQTDGFIAFGSSVTQSNTAISATTGTNNLAVAFNRDLKSKDNGTLSYLLSGTAPNRVFTIQWKNYRRSPTNAENDVINFQIQLKENGSGIVYHYGAMSLVNVSTAATVQVGIRGDSSTEFLNRTTTTDWNATTAGAANNANCRITDQIFPANGLMFTYAPPQQSSAPMAAQNPIPANSELNVHVNALLSWTSGGGNVDGYKVYLGSNNPPTNLVNGNTVTNTSYAHTANLNYNTVYYWKIVPFNDIGDAQNCPVWQFTTLTDPTVTSFPYTQDFDGVTAPALPIGWSTINSNNDAYTWETSDVNPHSTPNSSRMRYNTSEAANDWLVSPPLSLEADMAYQVKFYYRAHSATFVEKLSLAWGNAPTVAGLSNQIWQNDSINNVGYQEAQAVFTPTQSGDYYIGFKASSDANQYYLYLDSITISVLEDSMDPPTHLTAEVSGRNVNLNWWAPGQTPPPDPDLEDSFETYTDFALNFDPWVCVDVDQSSTYGMNNIEWPNAYAAQAFIVFNPSTTVPALTDLTAHDGNKMAACFAATTAPNNDWLISPQFTPSAGQYVNFWARSYTAQYGLERFKVGISQGGTAPADFTIISTGSYVQAPDNWTLYSYDMSSYAGQSIRFGINCVSNDAFFLLVDDVSVGPIPANRTHDSYAGQFLGNVTKTTGTPIPGPLYSGTSSRDLLGYKVYRDGTLIATITDTHYQDANVDLGTYSYTVTANYTAGESEPAGPITVTVAPNVFPPTNLAASVVGTTANLTWDEPIDPGEGMWLTWCQDLIYDAIGTNSAVTFDVAHRFTQADLAVVAGGTITEVMFAPHEANAVYTVKVWTGGSASNAGTLVSSQVVPNPSLDAWNTVTLNTPVSIPSTGDVYIGYECNTQTGFPAGCDNGPTVNGKGNMMYFNGSWGTLVALADIESNWLIQTYVDTGFGRVLLEPQPIVEAPVASHSNARLAKANMTPIYLGNPNAGSRQFLGYKVYRDGNLIDTTTDNHYSDEDLALGTYSYTVTADYTEGESVPAGPVEVVIADNPGPEDLTAEVFENNVTLNWVSPDGPMVGQWISWCTDLLGNSIGTGNPASFSVAHRFTQDDLNQMNITDGFVSHVKFVPAFADCNYTIKVWIDGSATNPGTLMATKAVTDFTLNEWNMVVLDIPIPLPTTGDLWVGYDVVTQGGHPAGCDDGLVVDGKGNMMYINGQWQTLLQVSSSLPYNWLIQTFVSDPRGGMKALHATPIVEAPMPVSTTDAQLSLHHVNVDNSLRAVSGFKVYRDGNLLATLSNPEASSYLDMGVPNGTYTYGVSAIHPNGESTPATIEVTVLLEMGETVFEDDFESYPDFATTFAPWSLLDQDNSDTYGFSGIDFPGSGSRMAYIIFNPTATVPPIDGLDAHSGNKMAASFAAVNGTNNDFLITPRVHLGSNSKLRFYAKSHTAQHGLERFRVGITMLPVITPQFQWLDANYIEAPVNWTEYIYDLNNYNSQNVYLAIRCVSDDAFVFYIDDVSVHSDGGSLVSGDDPIIPIVNTKLDSNYPNPFNPSTTIRYSLKEAGPVSIEIYNIKGQLVRTLVQDVKEAGNHTVIWNGLDKNNSSVSSGIYFYKMNAGKYSSTKKMIMMK